MLEIGTYESQKATILLSEFRVFNVTKCLVYGGFLHSMLLVVACIFF
jgi:hypothetical protein